MSVAAWTVLVALAGALLAALSGMYAANQARKVNVASVDKDIFDALRQDFLAAKAEMRELEREVDNERRRRRDMEDQLHRIARALYAANIAIPDNVAALMRPPPNPGPGP